MRRGVDRFDEVWEGVLHMIPPPSHAHQELASFLVALLGPYAQAAALGLTLGVGIGSGPLDYRVPDLALHRPGAAAQWHPTAALVVEILSPGDKSWDKLPFYAPHHVDEVLIVDPVAREVHWLALAATSDEYRPAERSALLALTPAELVARLDWPE